LADSYEFISKCKLSGKLLHQQISASSVESHSDADIRPYLVNQANKF